MNEELKSVDDIDEMLLKDFNIDDSIEDQTIEDDNSNENNDNNISDENDNVDNSQQGNDENGNEDVSDQSNESQDDNTSNNVSDNKHNTEDKKEFAFSKIRKENSDLKALNKTLSARDEALKKIASNYGYDDVDKFLEAYENARVVQEAKDKGYDPVLYKQLQDTNKRLEQLEKERQESNFMSRANAFKSAVDKAISDYNLDEEEGRNEIFNRLEEYGYTVDSILSLPNPEILIKGVLSDKIAEISKQKQIEKMEDLDNLSDERHDGNSTTKTMSLDDLIAQDIKEYKANNFYN